MSEAICLDRAAAEVTVRKAARALARAGLVGAYGHCSVRLSDDESLVCASKAMGTILPTDAGTVVPISGPLPEGVLGEVRVHQQIYRHRPDVGAICRVFPRVLLDWVYDVVAVVRFRIFGRQNDLCPAIPPALRSRFLP